MKLSAILLPLAAFAILPAAANAQDSEASADKAKNRDYIAFADHGGVRNWYAEDRDTIYFQDRRKNWYKAELLVPSHDLPYVLTIGIDTNRGSRLDKWGEILVKGRSYSFKSFERIEGEPPGKRDKKDETAEG
ncbi:MAG TPA: DUF6491 family protein [Sphingomonadaceae bacterium]|nr:DUF6491 family protein [Sphingomonadaceae bacterium]